MAEYIDKEAIRNELYREDALTMRGVKLINQFPAADVVEVVRCKDCRHYDKGACWDQDAYGRCWREDDYCSYGERKEG